jgi:hypothetical protein
MLSGRLAGVGCVGVVDRSTNMMPAPMLAAIAIMLGVDGGCRVRRAVHHHRRAHIHTQAGEQRQHAEDRDHAITHRGSDTRQT